MKPTSSAYRQARQLRRTMSLPEVLLWRHLRGSPQGVKIRRQHPVGPYVADFYVAAAKLIIEVDGAGHRAGERGARDERRDAWLAGQGYSVMRVAAAEALADAEGVADAVVRAALAGCGGDGAEGN